MILFPGDCDQAPIESLSFPRILQVPFKFEEQTMSKLKQLIEVLLGEVKSGHFCST